MKQAEPIWTRDFIMVVLINLFIFVYFYALLTVLPVYAMQELGGSESEGGLFDQRLHAVRDFCKAVFGSCY